MVRAKEKRKVWKNKKHLLEALLFSMQEHPESVKGLACFFYASGLGSINATKADLNWALKVIKEKSLDKRYK